MKKLLPIILFALVLVLPAHATIHQVKGLNASGSSVIIQPGSDSTVIIVQNNGANSVRLSLDGGVSYPANGGTGTNPTPTTGYLLAAGQQLTITTAPYTGGQPDPTIHKPIVAIMVTSTTTIDIVTNGVADVYPTN